MLQLLKNILVALIEVWPIVLILLIIVLIVLPINFNNILKRKK